MKKNPTPKNIICLWFNHDAQDAAKFYAKTFPNSKVTGVHKAPTDYPMGKKGDVLTVEFTVMGIPCLGLNGGLFYFSNVFKQNHKFVTALPSDGVSFPDAGLKPSRHFF